MKSTQQIEMEVRRVSMARVSQLSQEHLGFKPSNMDIIQKLAHMDRITDRLPCDTAKLREHITRKVKEFVAANYPMVRSRVIAKQLASFHYSQPIKLP